MEHFFACFLFVFVSCLTNNEKDSIFNGILADLAVGGVDVPNLGFSFIYFGPSGFSDATNFLAVSALMHVVAGT